MTKTGILAAAAALTLAIPAIASAQPFYGPGYGPAPRFAPGYVRHEDFRFERDREWRRAEDFRRFQWDRYHHAYGPRGYYGR